MPDLNTQLRRYSGMDHGLADAARQDQIAQLKAYLEAMDRGAANLARTMPQMGADPAQQVEGAVNWLMPTGTLAEAAQGARNIGKGTLQAIGVWHGSPHKFDKFSLSKIGTGEGAQAYGHGLYFAENPEVAKGYANAGTLSVNAQSSSTPTINGQPFDLSLAGGRAAQIPRKGFDAVRDEVVSILQQSLSAKPPRWAYAKGREKSLANILARNEAAIQRHKQWLSELDALKGADVEWLAPNLYKTSLEWPDPAREAADPLGPQHFLDWDKELGQQSEYVRNLLGIQDKSKQLQDFHAYRDSMRAKYLTPTTTLADMTPDERAKYEALYAATNAEPNIEGAWNARPANMFYHGNQFANDAEASQRLRDLGIPGIRYLDGGSRGAGNGTSNYVVFDDTLAKILERNGKSLYSGTDGGTTMRALMGYLNGNQAQ